MLNNSDRTTVGYFILILVHQTMTRREGVVKKSKYSSILTSGSDVVTKELTIKVLVNL